ncbi:hypothetical protein FG386_001047 [Cryptosporidium ryanae]|uniref:uncharacterized protein n=1 Tax=Cryptosporidium ryanae TaxID=515981 RepID=UPI00351A0E3B|nr:hypothetical protein FG386_001047 [Cryptosporidium ryanae]
MLVASEYYSTYEDEFLSTIQSIENLILKLDNNERGAKSKVYKREIDDLESKIRSAKNCLNRLKEEVSILSKNSDEYKSYQRYNNVYNEIYNKFENLKEDIIYNNGDNNKMREYEYKNNGYNSNKLINDDYVGDSFINIGGISTEDLMSRNEDNMRISSKLAQETQNIGLHSLNTLKIQRDNITRGIYGLSDIDYNIVEGRKLANELYRQKVLERLTLYVIITILLLANIYVFIKKITRYI